MKKGAALKSLGQKSCEIKSGDQEMAAMMLMLINFNSAHCKWHFLDSVKRVCCPPAPAARHMLLIFIIFVVL